MRILIWDNFPLKNTGGPSGYLYNIHKWLQEHPKDEISFLSDLLVLYSNGEPVLNEKHGRTSFVPHVPEWRRKLQSLPNYLKPWYPLTKLKCRIENFFFRFNKGLDIFERKFKSGINVIPKSIDLNEFDFIHFHLLPSLQQFLNSHPEYRGKTILTSHCPCPWTYEMLDVFNPPFRNYFRNLGIKNECEAYYGASYIMFPCEDAKEPYVKNKKVKAVFENRKESFFYVPTSILDLKTEIKDEHAFKRLGISKDAFVITYIGRHCSIKGYDILKKVGEKLLGKYSNLYFVCAGKGSIPPYTHERWIELGFIDYANEVHAQGDLYIIANKETFFDIGTLEVLRAGNHVILSNTGGNKYFRTLPSSDTEGIGYFEIDDIDHLCNMVEVLIQKKKSNPHFFANEAYANRLLFLKHFTIDKYIDKYISELQCL